MLLMPLLDMRWTSQSTTAYDSALGINALRILALPAGHTRILL